MSIITGHPNNAVANKVSKQIAAIISRRGVRLFYIGRTVDLPKTKSRHGADAIETVYETDSVDYAIDMEGEMIDRFYDDPRCCNDQEHGGGNVSPEWRQQVYVALWY
jgi:hypothetical protein